MRIYVLTQEDAFYIPVMLDHLLQSRRDVVGIGLVPGELQPKNRGRWLRTMRPGEILKTGTRLALYRAIDTASQLAPIDPLLPHSLSVTSAARRHGVPLEHVPKVNAPAFIDSLRARGVELLVSIACPQVMKRPLLDAVPRGAINIHGALLPKYQGLLPSFWVLANGEAETGVTVHWVDEKLDHGEILLQRRIPIERDDTVHSLVRRSKIEVGKHLLVEAIEAIERGTAPRQPMRHDDATYFSYPTKEALREFRRRGRRFI